MEEREASASSSAASLLSHGGRAEATDADPTATLHASLDALLVRHVPEAASEGGPTPTLERLAADAPQRVCTRTFSLGDVIWKCRTCQVGDETCVVCQACFQSADHKGHDVSFYVSRMPDGGCCDCGDETAWSPAGFCDRHGRRAELDSVPAPLRQPARAIFGATFGMLARVVLAAQRYPGPLPLALSPTSVLHSSSLRRLAAAIEWITKTCVAFDGLCAAASAALRAPLLEAAWAAMEGAGGGGSGGREDAESDAPELELANMGGEHAESPASPFSSSAALSALIRAAERGARDSRPHEDAGADAAESTLGSGAGLSLLEAVLLSDARLRDLGVMVPYALQALYLRLLTNADFKLAFAEAYVL